jgi:hypothetical protein
MNRKPATPLPWLYQPQQSENPYWIKARLAYGSAGVAEIECHNAHGQGQANAAYIAHACNKYPQLVKALSMHGSDTTAYENGEDSGYADWIFALTEIGGLPNDFDCTPTKISKLIRELREALRTLSAQCADTQAKLDADALLRSLGEDV